MTPSHPIIWTRRAGDWQVDRELFSDRDRSRVIRVPCLELRAVPVSPPAPFDRAIITSGKALTFARQHQDLWQRLQQAPIWTFGQSTYQEGLSLQLDMQLVTGANNGAELQAKLLTQWADSQKAPTLFLGAATPAYPLVEKMQAAGFNVNAVALYHTEAGLYGSSGDPLTAVEQESLWPKLSGVVCFASPSAVEGFLQGWGEPAAKAHVQSLRAAVIGTTTAGAAQGAFAEIQVSPHQSLKALAQLALSWD